MTVLAIIQARMGSTRLPGKVLGALADRIVLDRVVASARAIPGVDKVVVATGDDGPNDPIAAWCDAEAVPCRRGDERDVLARFAQVIEAEAPEAILRLTADYPL
ncbi:MAG: acylneuraminate cytidylyltransferase, partial [Rhodospirillaceae bacterium]|nr:acylneuraminate cytidylyltransferase [Rhodospirillaceae bacterium]